VNTSLAGTSLPLTSLPRALGTRWEGHLRKLVLECQARPCRRFTVSHRLLRRDGIYLGDAWHCSAACFEESLRRRLAPAAEGCVEPQRRPGRIPLRLLLVERGVLSEAQLRDALRLHGERGGSLEDVLLGEGFANERRLASAKADEAGCAVLLQPPSMPPSVQLPHGLMERYHAAIMHDSQTCLLLGFTRRLSTVLQRAVEQVTGTRAEACFVPDSMLGAMLRYAARTDQVETLSEPVNLPRSSTPWPTLFRAPAFPADAARGILRWAIDTGAERARMATGDRWAWVRLSGEQELDFYLPLRSGGSEPAT
jgi:hypothetical protein